MQKHKGFKKNNYVCTQIIDKMNYDCYIINLMPNSCE